MDRAKNEKNRIKRESLRDYQKAMIAFATKQKRCGLFLDMGLGKTATTLTIINDLLVAGEVSKVLIIAPLKVAKTVWNAEADKWEHLKHLDIGVAVGKNKIKRDEIIKQRHTITIINKEITQQVLEEKKSTWDMIIIDESSYFKNPSTKRFKALKKKTKALKSIILLTGTPAPKNIADLWSQLFLIDGGERLEKTITSFNNKYLQPQYFGSKSLIPKKGATEEVTQKISDICVTMKAKDYLKLPKITYLTYLIDPTSNLLINYKKLEKDFLITLKNEEKKQKNILASNISAKINKLIQLCNGFVYDDDGVAHDFHDLKIKALKDIAERRPDKNIMVGYWFKHDLHMLQKAFPEAVTLSKDAKELEQWNKGNIKMLLLQPSSAGHGLNAQYGGSIIVWYVLCWSLEIFQQFNARIHRQGQTEDVEIIFIMIKGLIDEVVLSSLNSKDKGQSHIINRLKHRAQGNEK